MKISVFLESVLPCWTIRDEQYISFQKKLPNADVILCRSKEEFLNALPGTQIAVIWYFKEEWFKSAPLLEWIITPAAGREYLPWNAPPNILMDNSSYHGILMAETVMGMMLSMVRGITDTVRMQETHAWPRDLLWQNMRPLRGSHLVILGYGKIGSWIARLAKPFGMKITGIKRTVVPGDDFMDDDDSIIEMARLHDVLPTADHLVLCLPGVKDTDNIIDEYEFSIMPEHSYIYNIGRGNAINENALINAVNTGSIKGAFLDVVKNEPLPEDSPLRHQPGIIIMPHGSAISPNYFDLFIDEFIEKFQKKYQ